MSRPTAEERLALAGVVAVIVILTPAAVMLLYFGVEVVIEQLQKIF